LLKQTSTLSTLNLGRAWYGPPQYLEVFKQHGLGVKAKFALLSFFSGNDAEDTRQYMRWQRGGEGGDYYSFIVGRKNFFIRYLHAFRDTYVAVRESIKPYLTAGQDTTGVPLAKESIPTGTHPDLGVFQLNGKAVPMVVTYWNRLATPEQLLSSDEWKRLRTVIGEFKAVALEHDILPIIVFIPTKAEVYGSFYSKQSGQRFLEKVRDQVQFENNTAEALETVAREQGVHVVNLLPHFRDLARRGHVLYHPFDTHWNISGRQAAAEIIAKILREASHSPRSS
jgi:hypothetical protein